MSRVPCDYRNARSFHPNVELFYVTLYLIITSEFNCSCFLHRSDFEDNLSLAAELGIRPFTKTFEVLVSKDFFPELFHKIKEYEKLKNVPCSDFD